MKGPSGSTKRFQNYSFLDADGDLSVAQAFDIVPNLRRFLELHAFGGLAHPLSELLDLFRDVLEADFLFSLFGKVDGDVILFVDGMQGVADVLLDRRRR